MQGSALAPSLPGALSPGPFFYYFTISCYFMELPQEKRRHDVRDSSPKLASVWREFHVCAIHHPLPFLMLCHAENAQTPL